MGFDGAFIIEVGLKCIFQGSRIMAVICRRFSLFVLSLFFLGVVTWLPGAFRSGNEEGYRFHIPPVIVRAGESLRIELQGSYESSAQGFQAIFSYPADELTIDRIHYEDTILESIGTDYFNVIINPDERFFAVAVLVDYLPPFTGAVIPSIGCPLTLAWIEGNVARNTARNLVLRTEDGLSNPPLRNVYVVDNEAIELSEPAVAEIRVRVRREDVFLRGDSNMDGRLDISDAIYILDYRYTGGPWPACMDAADANDDGRVDLSDPIFFLSFLFQRETPLPQPSPEPGIDGSSDGLGCLRPLYHLVGDRRF